MAEKKNFRRHGSRFRARRRAVDIFFEAETRDVDPVAIVQERRELSQDQNSGVAPINDYTAEMVQGAAERLDEIDEAIARYLSDDWQLDRLPTVDRAVLRIAAWEIMYNPEVDAPISIADGVEIASQYSTDVASPYINAVLDDIAQSLSEDNPMQEVAAAEEAAAEDEMLAPAEEESAPAEAATEGEIAEVPEGVDKPTEQARVD